jgi:hypothetical protein
MLLLVHGGDLTAPDRALRCREELLALQFRPGCRVLPPGLDADDLRWAGKGWDVGAAQSCAAGRQQRNSSTAVGGR